MKLIKFAVEKYRSIVQRSSMDVYDKTIILGPNNEGKSNILRALVTALRSLSTFASELVRISERKTLHYTGYISYYEWEKDYPVALQKTRGDIKNKKSIFTLNFELSDDEFHEFKSLTKINLKNKVIPIKIEINGNDVSFTLNIPGHFYKNASDVKMKKIASFISERINICYIDAERTASTATESIGSLLELQIRRIEANDEYKKVLQQIEKLYSPVLEEMSSKVNNLLQGFIPSIKETKITLPDNFANRRYIRRYPSFSIFIDDGVNTPLIQKGSGVQSMVALFLAQYVSTAKHQSDNFILAIDEPESHLHPQGIHDIKKILDNIALNNQVIIATHSPVLTQTSDPHKNIIVKDNYARQATKIAEIRDILGVHPADNLLSAELVLIVEGASDENMLPHMLSIYSPILKQAIQERRLIVLSCNGTDHMENFVKFISHQLCNIYIFADDDEAGRQVIANMKEHSVIRDNEYTLLNMPGLHDSEIEDLFDPKFYSAEIADKYGIDEQKLISCHSKKVKWSLWMKSIFTNTGKQWDDTIENELKILVSEKVKTSSTLNLLYYHKGSFEAGCQALIRFFTR